MITVNVSAQYGKAKTSKPSKAELLAARKMTLQAQLTDLHYGFITRDVILLSSSQSRFIRYGIDGADREHARVRLLRPLNRTIDKLLDPERREERFASANSRRVAQLLTLRDQAELHHVVPVSLLPVDEAPACSFGDQIAWWQDAAHQEMNLVSVVSEEHKLIHNYLFAQNLYSTSAIGKAERNFSEPPVIVKAIIPVQPGSIWGSRKAAPAPTLSS